MTLLLGITFGFGVVALAIGLFMMFKNAQPTVVLTNGTYGTTSTYKNEERWSVVKDKDGRVRDIVVHREATQT